ncbi:MAG TPA: hypothetical protein VGM82_22080 [Gemmatimonadaceae bacterium]|jgi:hypothetical protein
MSLKRIFPIASVFAVGALAFSLRIAAANPIALTAELGVKSTTASPSDRKMAGEAGMKQFGSLKGAEFGRGCLQNEAGYHNPVVAGRDEHAIAGDSERSTQEFRNGRGTGVRRAPRRSEAHARTWNHVEDVGIHCPA